MVWYKVSALPKFQSTACWVLFTACLFFGWTGFILRFFILNDLSANTKWMLLFVSIHTLSPIITFPTGQKQPSVDREMLFWLFIQHGFHFGAEQIWVNVHCARRPSGYPIKHKNRAEKYRKLFHYALLKKNCIQSCTIKPRCKKMSFFWDGLPWPRSCLSFALSTLSID